MLAKITTRKLLIVIIFPAILLLLQSYVKWEHGISISNFGTTLATLSLGQVFPFLFFEHTFLMKCFEVQKTYKSRYKGSTIAISYSIKSKTEKDINRLKNLTVLLFVTLTVLFFFTMFLGLDENFVTLHTVSGGVGVIMSTAYLLFT